MRLDQVAKICAPSQFCLVSTLQEGEHWGYHHHHHFASRPQRPCNFKLHYQVLPSQVALLHRVNLSNFVQLSDLLAPQTLPALLQRASCLQSVREIEKTATHRHRLISRFIWKFEPEKVHRPGIVPWSDALSSTFHVFSSKMQSLLHNHTEKLEVAQLRQNIMKHRVAVFQHP